MSWFIHHRGEHANNCYAEIYEAGPEYSPKSLDRYGPFETREEAVKKAEQRGLTLTSLQDLEKK